MNVLLSFRGADVALPRPYRLMAHGSRLLALCLVMAVVAWMAVGCREGGGVAGDARLLAVDSIVDTDSVAAWRQLQAIDSASLATDADRHLYALLHQQLRYAQYVTLDTAVLQQTVEFYGHGDGTFDRSHYVRALILMGGSHEDALRYPEAMEWYLRAINEADTADHRNLGQANARIGIILNRNFARHVVREPYFEKAYHHYKLTDDTPHTAAVASYLASTYRVTRHEKAHAALEEAARLCLACRDTFAYMGCREGLARCLYEDSLPRQSLAVLQEAIKAMSTKWLTNDFCYDASRAYATLGRPDSARAWLAKAAPASTPQERYFVFSCRERIARAEGDNAEAYRLAKVCSRLADSIASNKDVHALMRLEALDRDNASTAKKRAQGELARRSRLWAGIVAVLVIFGLFIMAALRIRARRHIRAIQEEWSAESARLSEEIEEKERQVALAEERQAQGADEMATVAEAQHTLVSAYLSALRALVSSSEQDSPKVFERKYKEFVSKFVNDDAFWHEITLFVDMRYHGAATKLRHDYPNLNDKELRLVELMLCGFGYKEIATLIGVNKNSMGKMRSRITEKMELREPLNEYVESLKVG